jgi:hypothetical protein
VVGAAGGPDDGPSGCIAMQHRCGMQQPNRSSDANRLLPKYLRPDARTQFLPVFEEPRCKIRGTGTGSGRAKSDSAREHEGVCKTPRRLGFGLLCRPGMGMGQRSGTHYHRRSRRHPIGRSCVIADVDCCRERQRISRQHRQMSRVSKGSDLCRMSSKCLTLFHLRIAVHRVAQGLFHRIGG